MTSVSYVSRESEDHRFTRWIVGEGTIFRAYVRLNLRQSKYFTGDSWVIHLEEDQGLYWRIKWRRTWGGQILEIGKGKANMNGIGGWNGPGLWSHRRWCWHDNSQEWRIERIIDIWVSLNHKQAYEIRDWSVKTGRLENNRERCCNT